MVPIIYLKVTSEPHSQSCMNTFKTVGYSVYINNDRLVN